MQIHTAQIHSWNFYNRQELSHLKNGIQIWLLDLNDCPLTEKEYAFFSEEELDHAAQFQSPEVRQCHLKSRLAVKLLGAYFSGVPAKSIQFAKETHGKPCWNLPVHFNISHSGDWAAAAFSCQTKLGIDIECRKKTPNMESIVHHFFHPEEINHWDQSPDETHKALFYRYWTMKEALLKGTGDGLLASTREFCLKPISSKTAASHSVWTAITADGRYDSWRLKPFPVPEGCTGSIAYRVLRN